MSTELEAYLHPVKESSSRSSSWPSGSRSRRAPARGPALGARAGAGVLVARPLVISGGTCWLTRTASPRWRSAPRCCRSESFLPAPQDGADAGGRSAAPVRHHRPDDVRVGAAGGARRGGRPAPRPAIGRRSPQNLTDLAVILRLAGPLAQPLREADNLRAALCATCADARRHRGACGRMAGAAAWLDRVTPRWLNMRDVGHVIIYAPFCPLVTPRRRWQNCSTRCLAASTAAGSERWAASSAPCGPRCRRWRGLAALLLLPFLFGLLTEPPAARPVRRPSRLAFCSGTRSCGCMTCWRGNVGSPARRSEGE